MKTIQTLKRNTLAVRLTDKDYEEFLKHAGTQYSLTLRELIVEFNKRKREEETPDAN